MMVSTALTCVVPFAVAGIAGLQYLDAFEPSPRTAVPDNTSRFHDPEDPDKVLEQVADSRTVNLDPETGGVVVPSSEQRLTALSDTGSLDIPDAALGAYRAAAATLANTDPSCRIDWALLAGIGRVESDHGRYGGARVAANGKTYPHILGVPLDGSPGVAAIADTDGGALDNDTTWDRAVGPMQFIPSTWAIVGADGDGDGERDPHDLDDAALASGAYLCAGNVDVSTRSGAEAAVFSYNHSDEYVAMVLAIAEAYRNGEIYLPSPPDGWGSGTVPTLDDVPSRDGRGDADAKADRTRRHVPDRRHAAQPARKPEPPAFIPADGTLSACGDSWCIDGKAHDFGTADYVEDMQAADYDGSGQIEPIVDELSSLAGTRISAEVRNDGAKTTIHTLQGLPYRNGAGDLLGTPVEDDDAAAKEAAERKAAEQEAAAEAAAKEAAEQKAADEAAAKEAAEQKAAEEEAARKAAEEEAARKAAEEEAARKAAEEEAARKAAEEAAAKEAAEQKAAEEAAQASGNATDVNATDPVGDPAGS